MDRIDAISGGDQPAPAATRWDQETVIDDEDM
jgi:hypothetical protein